MTEEKNDNVTEKSSSCGCSVSSKSFLLFIVALLALGVVGYALIGDPGSGVCGINNADGTAVSCSKAGGCAGGACSSSKSSCGSSGCSADKAACSKEKACCGSEGCLKDKDGCGSKECSKDKDGCGSGCSKDKAACSEEKASCSSGQCPATQIVQQNQ